MKNVKVDENTCIGCGLCVNTCPKVFEMIDGHAAATTQPSAAEEAAVSEAIEGCPVTAISAER